MLMDTGHDAFSRPVDWPLFFPSAVVSLLSLMPLDDVSMIRLDDSVTHTTRQWQIFSATIVVECIAGGLDEEGEG